eukprot:TRINITY_DN834_c0_g1_i1.p1 TRINITY_DN834_c0_g1~~TRINITY_DN834_c0_g1_i1.p1  ORF type:complete len:126 (+),score=7.67 TRINITY_DN834_c0_g1_i1:104-481(+)
MTIKKSSTPTNKSQRKYNTKKQFSHIPAPLNIPGKWVARSEFLNKQSFGYYRCLCCKKTWMSAYSQPNYGQACRQCDVFYLPICMWQNDENSKRKRKTITIKGPHDAGRCEACKHNDCSFTRSRY